MTTPRCCHEIVIDKDAGEIRLDGLADVDPEQIAAREHAPIFEAVMAEHDGSGER